MLISAQACTDETPGTGCGKCAPDGVCNDPAGCGACEACVPCAAVLAADPENTDCAACVPCLPCVPCLECGQCDGCGECWNHEVDLSSDSDESDPSDVGSDMVSLPCLDGCDVTLLAALAEATSWQEGCTAASNLFSTGCLDACQGTADEAEVRPLLESCGLLDSEGWSDGSDDSESSDRSDSEQSDSDECEGMCCGPHTLELPHVTGKENVAEHAKSCEFSH